MTQRRILVVAAHCDDETFGCGGLIARVVDDGGFVCVLVASHTVVTNVEFNLACDVLGVGYRAMLGFPTTGLPNYLSPMADAIRNVIFQQEISEVYTHSRDDTHQDHQAVSCATRIGAGPCRSLVWIVAEYESPLSSIRADAFAPNVFVEIDIERKIAALANYKSQILAAPSQRSVEVVRALSVVRGSQLGVHHAEGFRIIKGVLG